MLGNITFEYFNRVSYFADEYSLSSSMLSLSIDSCSSTFSLTKISIDDLI